MELDEFVEQLRDGTYRLENTTRDSRKEVCFAAEWQKHQGECLQVCLSEGDAEDHAHEVHPALCPTRLQDRGVYEGELYAAPECDDRYGGISAECPGLWFPANAIVPLLIGPQGSGKTTFCSRLLPGYLQTYFNDRISMKRPVVTADSRKVQSSVW